MTQRLWWTQFRSPKNPFAYALNREPLQHQKEIRLPRKDPIDDDEGRLGRALGVIRKSLQAKYQGKELEEIEDVNDRKVFEVIMRLDKEYNPRKAKKDALSQAKNERDNAKYLNKETVDLEQQVEAQLNERGKNHEE